MKEKNNRLKISQKVAVILLIILIGCASLSLGLRYYYKEELKDGVCSLCFRLNPAFTACQNVNQEGIPYLRVIFEDEREP